MAEHPTAAIFDDTDIGEVLNRAEGLLTRNRSRMETTLPPPPPAELPTLTEVAESDEDRASRGLGGPGDAGTRRVEMLAELAPVLEKLVEARVGERLSAVAAHIAQLVKAELERDIKFIVREAIDQALLTEVERVNATRRHP